MSHATPTIDREIVLKEGESLFLDLEGSLTEAPICEILPLGKPCFRTAEYVGVISTHGCRRDNVQILMCPQCRERIHGGSACALCSHYPIFLASSRAI